MEAKTEIKCSFCGLKACCSEEQTEHPEFCPMTKFESTITETNKRYAENAMIHSLTLESARVEAEGYGRWTRIEETINFAKRLGVKNIGIAHCEGLRREALVVHKIMMTNGFQVSSVCCKVGKLDKMDLGLKNDEKIHPGQFEPACNPIVQAEMLSLAGSEFNIVIGLCVGHDSLFMMHSKVPTTVLIVKDRVLGHNPAAALYTSQSYYKRLMQ